jgi:hypothetical protein
MGIEANVWKKIAVEEDVVIRKLTLVYWIVWLSVVEQTLRLKCCSYYLSLVTKIGRFQMIKALKSTGDQTNAPSKTHKFKSGFGFSIFWVFGLWFWT